jgi:alpha-tubulin suppressor-like RCC1 family protein
MVRARRHRGRRGRESRHRVEKRCAVWAWGANGSGQLSDGGTTTRSSPVPVSGLTGAVGIAAGENHSVASLTSDGRAGTWDANGHRPARRRLDDAADNARCR